MTAWKFNPELTFEQAGSDWIVLDADAGVVLRASGPAAHVLTAIAAPGIAATGIATGADLLPAHLDDTLAALAERGVIVANTSTNTNTNTDAHPAAVDGATAGITRRRLIGTSALAAGAATLATTAGIHTLILPTAASAASPSATLAAPTGVTATPGESQQIIVTWTNVGDATSYKVFYRIFGSSDPYDEFVPPSTPITAGPVTVTGLTNTTTYEFYVVAINATTPSEPSTPLATATAAVPPGSIWTSRNAAVDNPWKSVTYGNSLFVAVANTGTNRAMTSPDGITWTSQPWASIFAWSSVTYGMIDSSVTSTASGTLVPGFVIVGARNRVPTSPDGITWTLRTPPGESLQQWRSVTFRPASDGVGALFVAVASTGTTASPASRVITSPNGITWTLRASAAENSWNSVTYGMIDSSVTSTASDTLVPGFVAVANTGAGNRVMTSPDGITWTIRTSAADNSWSSVTYGNGRFVAVATDGTDRVMTSPDGITWTIRTTPANNSWNSVTYGNGRFVAVSSDGTGNRVMTSPDGITWTSRTSAANNNWDSVTSGNGLFVAVASSGTGNRVMTSP